MVSTFRSSGRVNPITNRVIVPWVTISRRLSPNSLISIVSYSGECSSEYPTITKELQDISR